MELKINDSDNQTNNTSTRSMKSYKTQKSEKMTLNVLGISKQKENQINNLMRKYSYDPKLYIKNFVPVLRPKENDLNLIPSKLKLNNKKRNSLAISHPSSEDEDDISNDELSLSNSFINSVFSDSSSDNENDNEKIMNKRKNFTKIRKNSLYRNISKKNMNKRKTGKISLDYNEEKDLKQPKSYLFNKIKESDNILNNPKLLVLPKKSFDIISSLKNNENLIYNNLKTKQRKRINSFAILETLENKLKLEK